MRISLEWSYEPRTVRRRNDADGSSAPPFPWPFFAVSLLVLVLVLAAAALAVKRVIATGSARSSRSLAAVMSTFSK